MASAAATAPDPPGADDPIPTLRRLSTTCSSDPPETDVSDRTRHTGLDPSKCQTSSNLQSSMTSRKTDSGGALVLYEYDPDPDSPATDPPIQETRDSPQNNEEIPPEAGAIVKSDPRDRKTPQPTVKGQELVVKQPPSEDLRRGFDHCFVTVPFKERLSVLFATLRRSSERKVIVICSTWESSKFHAILFRQLEMLHVYELHEKMEGQDLARAYDDFMYLYPGILFASEISMREFDIPKNIDYIIQYEPPMNPTDYIYRHSNAKIYKTSCHKALLFLTPEEMNFLDYFDQIPKKELEARKVSEFQGSAEKLVSKHSELNGYAWMAFRAFVNGYHNHSHRKVYDKSKLDESGVRKSFGQPHLPEYSSKYFAYNQGSDDRKRDSGGEKNRVSVVEKKREEEDGNDQQRPKPHQWNDKEKTWRKTPKKPHEWMEKNKKSWKHTHVNI